MSAAQEIGACPQCKHREEFRGTVICGKVVRAMFGTPVSCWSARSKGMPCGPFAFMFQPEKRA